MNLAEIMINFSEVPDETLYYYQRLANRRFFGAPRRIYRILRDYPKPMYLPTYSRMMLVRLTKGMLGKAPLPPRCFPEEQEVAVQRSSG
jgi:hypothetical protein